MKRGVVPLALLAAALAAPALPALAQDLSARRGFSVEITAPENQDIVSGETTIEVDVEAREPGDVEKVEFFIDDELRFTDAERPYKMVHDFGSLPGVHVVRVVAHHRTGATVSDFIVTRSLDVRYFVDVRRVILDVSVRDEEGRLVTGLPESAFSVTEDGQPQRIIEVSPEERPILAGILIDSSGSMRDRMEIAQEAACQFIKTLRDEDRGFAVDFDEAVYLIETITPDRDALCRSVKTTKAIGGTALYDAIHAAYRVSHREEAERRALIILSDGDDTASQLELEALREEALASEVTIYAIGLDVGALTEARLALRRLTEDTGGRAFFVKKPKELAAAYQQISDELRSLYQVTYASGNEERDGRFIELEVDVAGDYDVRHRRGYYAVP
jgi:VWFA-related protein